jgi:pyruvate formate lyase activating enzyme
VHLEITHLVIPTLNDDLDQFRAMCQWIVDELGSDVPLHLARFYPLYQLANLPPTPVRTLDRARAAAREAGLQYVYVARVTGHEGESTFCPQCGETVIQRLGFVVEEIRMKDGRCARCGTPTPGLWG